MDERGFLGLSCELHGRGSSFMAGALGFTGLSSLGFTRFFSSTEILKEFLTLGIEDGVQLKWKAVFGSTLASCVIVGASSVLNLAKDKRDGNCDSEKSWLLQENGASEHEDTGNIPESFYTNGGLKLRVVWTISSLIAASARHYLLQNIISEHPTLENLILTDSDQQGVLCMNKSQLQEFHDKPLAASASSNRTQVPALNMKLWYAPCLELLVSTQYARKLMDFWLELSKDHSRLPLACFQSGGHIFWK